MHVITIQLFLAPPSHGWYANQVKKQDAQDNQAKFCHLEDIMRSLQSMLHSSRSWAPKPPVQVSGFEELVPTARPRRLDDSESMPHCKTKQLIASCKTKLTKLTPRLQVWYFLDEWFGPVLTGLSWIGLRGVVMLKYTTELATMLCTAWTCASGTKFSTSTASIKQYQGGHQGTDWLTIHLC